MPDEFDGRAIRKARRAADITQTELAEMVDLPTGQSPISRIEREDQHIRSWRIIERIRQALQIE